MKYSGFPPQMKSDREKGDKWRKACVDWAKDSVYSYNETIRSTYKHKKINYDLLNGKLYMDDIKLILNPSDIKADYIPNKIQHYPIINTKIQVLRGEEYKRIFDYKVIITNPNAVSEIEDVKKQEFFKKFQDILQNNELSQEDYQSGMEKLSNYFTYDYQDFREIRANALINHYSKEYDFPNIFNKGFVDCMCVGEEIYRTDIEGGEPILERINPLKIRAYKYGYSNRIEDASIIVTEDYLSPERILDIYYDDLSNEDVKKIENYFNNVTTGGIDSMGNEDPRVGMHRVFVGEDGIIINTDNNPNDTDNILGTIFSNDENGIQMPSDMNGNIRVLRIYWKSKRKIKRIKTYNQQTGEEEYMLYPQDYKIVKDMGEEEKSLWVNEAWEGTLIGDDVYVNIRPRLVQYNTMDNPSRCHFGFIGQIYNINENVPFSMVDMMKPYNYLYDVIHERLNNLISRNWGTLIRLDFAKIPKGWTIDQYLYFAKTSGIAVEDSFKVGNEGPALGKMAGALNNASNGVIQAELRDSITTYTNLLEYIKNEMSEAVGITKQREGQVMASETVGGVERANLQSSYITEYLFAEHENLKKRVIEAFLETSKIAMKGKSKKFNYILPDHSMKLIEINGDEFAENDYGLVVDASQMTQKLNQNLETLAQAALQNQMINFSDIMKLYTSASLAEKQRIIETSEKKKQEEQQQQLQQQQQMQEQQLQAQQQALQTEQEFKDKLNQRDNATKIQVAEIQAQGNRDYLEAQMELHSQKGEHDSKVLEQKADDNEKNRIQQQKQFDKKMELEKEKTRMNNIVKGGK